MNRFTRKAINMLEMPNEVVSKEPKVTINAFNEVIIENFKGILEYEEFFVRISTFIGNVIINGFNMKLEQLNEDDILITGKIENVTFEK
jgi:sporulation protein YqfC